jgi:gamma-glutamyltranspeptidase/glutathione hydrolase
VAAGCSQAVAAALDCTRAGGNLIDAAIAGAAVQTVVMPEATSLGGDLFALLRRCGRIVSVNATGTAPQAATIEAFRERGLSFVPRTGPLSVQPPGLVAGLVKLHELGGSKALAELFEPAIDLADRGCLVSAKLADALLVAPAESRESPVWRAIYAPEGRPLQVGESLRQPALARTLRAIGEHGAQAFYSGMIARDIANTLRSGGGMLREADLADVRAKVVEPLRVRFRQYQVSTQPPVSQGFILLHALRMLDAATQDSDVVSQQCLWEMAAIALRQGFAERLRLLGDGADHLARSFLAEDTTLDCTNDTRLFANQGSDTTTLSITDGDNTIALIQSIYADLGSGIVTPDTGILLNNRLSGFFLDHDHANGLKPGRSTMHTLHSFIVEDDTGLCWAGGTPGGDHQPQVNLQVIVRLLLLGQRPELALGAPRWTTSPGTRPIESRTDKTEFLYESGVHQGLLNAIAGRGWDVRESSLPIGSSKVVGILAPDSVGAWADTRRHGAAGAY